MKSESVAITPVLQAAIDGQSVILRVHGRASFAVAPALKQFGAAMMDQGRYCFVIDMRECVNMDSTFMGILAGLAMRLKREGGRMAMINLSAASDEALMTLGLNKMITCYRDGAAPEGGEETCPGVMKGLDLSRGAPDSTRDVMIEAHAELSGLSEGNAAKFKDVLILLRDEARQTNGRSRGGA